MWLCWEHHDDIFWTLKLWSSMLPYHSLNTSVLSSIVSHPVLLFSPSLTESVPLSALIIPLLNNHFAFFSALTTFPSLLPFICLLHTNTAFVLNWHALLNKGHPPINLLCSTFPFLLLPPAFLRSLPFLSSVSSGASVLPCMSLITTTSAPLQTLVQQSHRWASGLLIK